ncbi:MAG: (2Fe-2S)-binding protein [Betaproteobacteria bacterium]|nr:(2Fe-2S)-binding protein [Betaproteobacteria bacterium]
MPAGNAMTRQDDYGNLVQTDRAHGSIYTSQAVFDAEMARIFHRAWVCVGHAGEIPNPGDFRVTRIGLQSVIMVRGADGEVRVLMNRCRHRGLSLTEAESGNLMHFVCPYHGWAYDNTGALTTVPHVDGYGPDWSMKDFGMTPAPRFGTYRGFVFASLAQEGMTLDQHLHKTKPYIDLFLNVSPLGEIEVRSGMTKTLIHANWKFVGMDGYHSAFVHTTFFNLLRRQRAQEEKTAVGKEVWTGAPGNVTRDLGNGHVLLDISPVRTTEYPHYLETMAKRPWWSAYYASMVKAYGQRRADEILIWEGDPHMGLFPNVQLIQSQIRIIRPVRVDLTEILMIPTTLKGVPEPMNTQRLRRQEEFYGPASRGSPDDAEVFERNQLGLSAAVDPWVYLARGLHNERVESDGTIVGSMRDEIPQRGQLRQWKAMMREAA